LPPGGHHHQHGREYSVAVQRQPVEASATLVADELQDDALQNHPIGAGRDKNYYSLFKQCMAVQAEERT